MFHKARILLTKHKTNLWMANVWNCEFMKWVHQRNEISKHLFSPTMDGTLWLVVSAPQKLLKTLCPVYPVPFKSLMLCNLQWWKSFSGHASLRVPLFKSYASISWEGHQDSESHTSRWFCYLLNHTECYSSPLKCILLPLLAFSRWAHPLSSEETYFASNCSD